MAAKYEFEANESIESARNLFQRALRFLPKCAKLWLEVISTSSKLFNIFTNH